MKIHKIRNTTYKYFVKVSSSPFKNIDRREIDSDIKLEENC